MRAIIIICEKIVDTTFVSLVGYCDKKRRDKNTKLIDTTYSKAYL